MSLRRIFKKWKPTQRIDLIGLMQIASSKWKVQDNAEFNWEGNSAKNGEWNWIFSSNTRRVDAWNEDVSHWIANEILLHCNLTSTENESGKLWWKKADVILWTWDGKKAERICCAFNIMLWRRRLWNIYDTRHYYSFFHEGIILCVDVISWPTNFAFSFYWRWQGWLNCLLSLHDAIICCSYLTSKALLTSTERKLFAFFKSTVSHLNVNNRMFAMQLVAHKICIQPYHRDHGISINIYIKLHFNFVCISLIKVHCCGLQNFN